MVNIYRKYCIFTVKTGSKVISCQEQIVRQLVVNHETRGENHKELASSRCLKLNLEYQNIKLGG